MGADVLLAFGVLILGSGLQVLLKCIEMMFPVQNISKIPFPAHKRDQHVLFPDFFIFPLLSSFFSEEKEEFSVVIIQGLALIPKPREASVGFSMGF